MPFPTVIASIVFAAVVIALINLTPEGRLQVPWLIGVLFFTWVLGLIMGRWVGLVEGAKLCAKSMMDKAFTARIQATMKMTGQDKL